ALSPGIAFDGEAFGFEPTLAAVTVIDHRPALIPERPETRPPSPSLGPPPWNCSSRPGPGPAHPNKRRRSFHPAYITGSGAAPASWIAPASSGPAWQWESSFLLAWQPLPPASAGGPPSRGRSSRWATARGALSALHR